MDYRFKYISTNTTTHVVTGSENLTLHTVICPVATSGDITFQDTVTPTTYFVLPAGSVGSFRLDLKLPLGLDVVTASADKVILTYKIP